MTALNFGAGTVIGRRTDIANPTPMFMGVLQDITIEFNQSLTELIGQYKVAVDVAPAELKITGKAKQAKIQANMVNDMLFGQTLQTASGQALTTAEAVTPVAVTFTVANAATFKEDLGLFYASNGVQLTRVASGPIVGQYSVNETTGVYTIVVADEVPLLVYYSFGVTTQKQIVLSNQLMGVGPGFEINLSNTYKNNAGITSSIFLRLNACRSSKMTLPFKNIGYVIPEFDFQAFCDSANNWGLWVSSE